MTEKRRSRAQVLAYENRRLRTLLLRSVVLLEDYEATVLAGYKRDRAREVLRQVVKERERGGW